MDLYNYNFTFRRDDAKGLTEDEFGKMMDYYQISETQRYGSRAQSLVIDHQESGPIRKTILIFARSKNVFWKRLSAYSTAVMKHSYIRYECV